MYLAKFLDTSAKLFFPKRRRRRADLQLFFQCAVRSFAYPVGNLFGEFLLFLLCCNRQAVTEPRDLLVGSSSEA